MLRMAAEKTKCTATLALKQVQEADRKTPAAAALMPRRTAAKKCGTGS